MEQKHNINKPEPSLNIDMVNLCEPTTVANWQYIQTSMCVCGLGYAGVRVKTYKYRATNQ